MKNLIKMILLVTIITSVSSCRLISYTKQIDTSIRKKGLDPTRLQFYTASEFRLTLDSADIDYKIQSGKLKQTNTDINDLLYCKKKTKCVLESPSKAGFQKYVFNAGFYGNNMLNQYLALSFLHGDYIKMEDKKYRASIESSINNAPDTRRVCLMIRKSDLRKLEHSMKRIKGKKVN